MSPDFRFEEALWHEGVRFIAGMDEAGRGAWAGPVVAAAVVLPPNTPLPQELCGLDDSKLLSPARRQELFRLLVGHVLAYGVGIVPAEEIDRMDILPATRLAMTLALQGLSHPPEALLVDAVELPEIECRQEAIIHGDARCFSIAAASIIAKVTRDQWMIAAHGWLPGYGFARHKGYGTPEHQETLRRLGPSAIHRRTYAPVRELLPHTFSGMEDPAP